MLRKHISSEQYLPRHFLRFVREKAAWMAAKPSRAEEFSLHVATLLARRVLPDAVINEATQLLNDARSRKAAGEGGAEELASATTARSKASGSCCCACGTPVSVPAMLVCVNKVSHFYFLRSMDANRSLLSRSARTVSTTTVVWGIRRRRWPTESTGSARHACRFGEGGKTRVAQDNGNERERASQRQR